MVRNKQPKQQMGKQLDGETNLQHVLVIDERLSKRMGEGAR